MLHFERKVCFIVERLYTVQYLEHLYVFYIKKSGMLFTAIIIIITVIDIFV